MDLEVLLDQAGSILLQVNLDGGGKVCKYLKYIEEDNETVAN